jgi:hypothetical protein
MFTRVSFGHSPLPSLLACACVRVCVQGNLAPAGAVLKFSGKAPRVFKGPAKVYNSERLGNTRTHLPACLPACLT